LIDAETALLEARFRRAEAESDQRIAIAALRKALAVPQLDSQPVRP
jgi:outer membrane protein TolC